MKRIITSIVVVVLALTANAQNFEWTAQTSGVTKQLNEVFFTDAQNGWVVGNNGVIISTTNGGQNWTSQTSGTSEHLRAVFFIDNNTVFETQRLIKQ